MLHVDFDLQKFSKQQIFIVTTCPLAQINILSEDLEHHWCCVHMFRNAGTSMLDEEQSGNAQAPAKKRQISNCSENEVFI